MSKLIITLLLLAMIASLGVGLYHLLSSPKEGQSSDQLYKSLRLRIGIWVVLFVFILLSLKMGWITPSNSVHPVNFNAEQQKRLDSANP